MQIRNIVYFVASGAIALAGCGQAPTPPPKPDRPQADPQASVAGIRAAGAQFDSSVEVHPLRDPMVEGLLKKAHDSEAQGQPAQALGIVRQALAIVPNAPELLQYQAELLIETGDWQQGAASAQKSYELGPKVGALCARNLETLVQARSTLGDASGAAQAREQAAGCKVPAPTRY